MGYRGWIGCEYKPLTTTESGLSWIKNTCLEEMKMKVGFIGLGIMGAPMAEKLLAGGHTLYAHTRMRCRRRCYSKGPSPAAIRSRWRMRRR